MDVEWTGLLKRKESRNPRSLQLRGSIQHLEEKHKDQTVINRGPKALERSIRMTINGRVDFTLDGVNVLKHMLPQMGVRDKVRFAGDVGEAVPLYLGFSKKYGPAAEYAEIWTNGVRDLRKSGKLQQILAKYGVKDTMKPAE